MRFGYIVKVYLEQLKLDFYSEYKCRKRKLLNITFYMEPKNLPRSEVSFSLSAISHGYGHSMHEARRYIMRVLFPQSVSAVNGGSEIVNSNYCYSSWIGDFGFTIASVFQQCQCYWNSDFKLNGNKTHAMTVETLKKSRYWQVTHEIERPPRKCNLLHGNDDLGGRAILYSWM